MKRNWKKCGYATMQALRCRPGLASSFASIRQVGCRNLSRRSRTTAFHRFHWLHSSHSHPRRRRTGGSDQNPKPDARGRPSSTSPTQRTTTTLLPAHYAILRLVRSPTKGPTIHYPAVQYTDHILRGRPRSTDNWRRLTTLTHIDPFAPLLSGL